MTRPNPSRAVAIVVYAVGAMACLAVARGAEPTLELRYSVLMMGNPAGSQVTRIVRDAASGVETRDSDWEFNDRGRGPKVASHLVVGTAGLIEKLDVVGVDYMKTPVTERFSLDPNGRAAWENPAEKGEKAAASGAFYTSLNGAPEEVAALARALLRAPRQTLPLLPEGEARIERIGDLEVAQGSGDARRTQRVTHYALRGLGFTPDSIWLDADGEYFGSAGGWLNIVRVGWEGSLPDMEREEKAVIARRSAALAQRLLRRPAALAVRNARLFDPATGAVRPGTTILVRGTTVAAVGPDAEIAVPAGAEVHDAGGATVLPGLFDMHTHVSDLDGVLHLAAGVTSVRDLANDIDTLTGLKRRWDNGEGIGPRLFLAGFIDGPGPYAGPTKVLVDTEADAVSWVNKYADLGYVQIKLYSSLKPELVPAIVREAHRRGLRVSGHIPNGMTAEECVRLGFDELQHANFLFLNFWKKEVPETRTPARFHAIGERAAALDLQSAPVRDFLRLLAERRTVVDPTLETFESLFLTRPGFASPGYAVIGHRLPPQVRRSTLLGGITPPSGMEERYREGFRAMVRMVGELYKAGVPIVAGTDDLAGFALHREFELYAEAGIPNAEILKLATLGAARVLGRERDLGSVEPGKLADFVVVEGDPLAKISDVRNTRLVVKDGIAVRPEDLYREVGILP